MWFYIIYGSNCLIFVYNYIWGLINYLCWMAIKKRGGGGVIVWGKKNSGKLLESLPKITIFVEFLGGSAPPFIKQLLTKHIDTHGNFGSQLR